MANENPMLDYLVSQGFDLNEKRHTSYKLKTQGFMDLTVESWIENGVRKISVCHYYEQEGDLMRDPEIVYRVTQNGNEIPEYFRQDNLGIEQFVFHTVNDESKIDPELLEELKSFTKTWVQNLKQQGHKLVSKEVEQ